MRNLRRRAFSVSQSTQSCRCSTLLSNSTFQHTSEVENSRPVVHHSHADHIVPPTATARPPDIPRTARKQHSMSQAQPKIKSQKSQQSKINSLQESNSRQQTSPPTTISSRINTCRSDIFKLSIIAVAKSTKIIYIIISIKLVQEGNRKQRTKPQSQPGHRASRSLQIESRSILILILQSFPSMVTVMHMREWASKRGQYQ